eukprot:TRINITY_DN7563_c0_g1_i2.p1 TRINITY_DN7563_c0_g1~~TRINITY_DN7563_c0_g1_i2.p1  ORF type:complete len:295 (+),score=80.41 TRINITY_DN7563_c0_g1_i2:145-1029(+)
MCIRDRTMSMSFKLYYLMQVSFWVQMAFITLIEKWQKDFIQMMAHHFITIGLTSSSYFFGFTRAGHVVLVEQDFADIFLPLAKMFKYFTESADKQLALAAGRVARDADHDSIQQLIASETELTSTKRGSKPWLDARKRKTKSITSAIDYAAEMKDPGTIEAQAHRERRLAVHGNICDALFAVFTLAWIPTRHGFFFWILYSVVKDADRVLGESGVLGWNPAEGLFCVPGVTINVFLAVLLVFQFLLVLWLMDLIAAVKKALFVEKSITEMEGFDVHEADSDDDDEMTQSLKKDR